MTFTSRAQVGAQPADRHNGGTFGANPVPNWRVVHFRNPEVLSGFMVASALYKPDKRHLVIASPGLGGWWLSQFIAADLGVAPVVVDQRSVGHVPGSILYVGVGDGLEEWANESLHYIILPRPSFSTFMYFLHQEGHGGTERIHYRDKLGLFPQSPKDMRKFNDIMLEDTVKRFWRRIVLTVPLHVGQLPHRHERFNRSSSL
jgi:hypothetical protein